jgi:opacity protein-like surface antigen
MTIRKLLAVALLAPTVALAAPASKSKAPPAEAAPAEQPLGTGLEVGGFLGYEAADFSGLALRVDGVLPFRDLAPQVKLSFVGSIGYSHLTWDVFGVTATANMLKFVPAARFSVPVAPQFEVFGDVGLGIAYTKVSVDVPGFGEVSDSSTNLMMRLGAGGWYNVNPKIKVGAMIDIDPVFGNFGTSTDGVAKSETFWSLLVGAMFKL